VRFPVQVAGEVVGFDEFQYVDPKDRQHVSRVVPLGAAAVGEALQDAGVDTDR
jgi:3-oxoacyl-(acyl-carrier-protein) synthase